MCLFSSGGPGVFSSRARQKPASYRRLVRETAVLRPARRAIRAVEKSFSGPLFDIFPDSEHCPAARNASHHFLESRFLVPRLVGLASTLQPSFQLAALFARRHSHTSAANHPKVLLDLHPLTARQDCR